MLKIKPTWVEQIVEAQDRNPSLQKIKEQLGRGKYANFEVGTTGELRVNGLLCVPKVGNLREDIMDEAHKAPLCHASRDYKNVLVP